MTETAQCAPCDETEQRLPKYHRNPGLQLGRPAVEYHTLPAVPTIEWIAKLTPKPKGHTSFSTIEVVHQGGPLAERLASSPWLDHEVPVRFYELPETHGDPTLEYNAIFDIENKMMLNKANRQSLVIWAGHPDKLE